MVMSREGRLRVVIADDTADVRSLLQYTFELDGRFEVVAQAANGADAVTAAAAHQPDAVVLDLAMPVMDGLAAIPRIKEASPRTRIVVLSGFGGREMAERAVSLGADRYVEKTTFQTLTSVLTEICIDEPDAVDVAVDEADAEEPAVVEAEQVPDLNGRMLRQVRWAAVVFALTQFWLYHPPDGLEVPFPQRPVGFLVAAALVAVNVVSRRRPSPWFELVADSAIVLSVISMFSFDASSELWTLLLVPVIEGAMRAQFRGAIAVWAATGALYTAREAWSYAEYAHRHFHLEALTYQLGVVLLVAVATGRLASGYASTSAGHRRAWHASERRAELLELVAASSRRLAALNVEQLLGGVVEAAESFGFERVELCYVEAATWTWVEQEKRPALDPGLAEAVTARQATVLVHSDVGPDAPGRAWLAAGFTSVVATPIYSGMTVVAVLVAATRQAEAVTAPVIECLELLASQAGIGLVNVTLLDRTRHQALHDALTGLPNQLLFEDRVAQALTHAARSNNRVALLFVDLDRFKKINDNLGHDYGNQLLRQVAGRLLNVVRAGDTVARMGGDEFNLLLPGLASDSDAAMVAAKVVEALQAPFQIREHQLFVSASVGIAVYPADGLRHESLLKHADIAMYRAKAAGGNTYELYASHADEVGAYPRLTLEADLHMALPRHELRVVYQPQLDLRDGGGVVGVEALIRWRHPELGDVQPVEFLPLAEETGLIGAIDAWVLETACAQAASWWRASGVAMRVAVNVSARQLQQPCFAASVESALAAAGLPGSMLELEVTEGAAVTEVLGVRTALTSLRALGVRVAIDDFGTGYSMLSRLQDFPLDTLKIDRSFIAEIHSADDDAPIVAATIAMARSLGLEVVAEGVEEAAQLGFLRAAGCDLAQGFYLSHPVEEDAVIDLVPTLTDPRAATLTEL